MPLYFSFFHKISLLYSFSISFFILFCHRSIQIFIKFTAKQQNYSLRTIPYQIMSEVVAVLSSGICNSVLCSCASTMASPSPVEASVRPILGYFTIWLHPAMNPLAFCTKKDKFLKPLRLIGNIVCQLYHRSFPNPSIKHCQQF